MLLNSCAYKDSALQKEDYEVLQKLRYGSIAQYTTKMRQCIYISHINRCFNARTIEHKLSKEQGWVSLKSPFNSEKRGSAQKLGGKRMAVKSCDTFFNKLTESLPSYDTCLIEIQPFLVQPPVEKL